MTMDIKQAKPVMARKTKVTFDGTDYIVTACILRLKGKEWYYQLELKELKAKNSVIIADMERVEVEDE